MDHPEDAATNEGMPEPAPFSTDEIVEYAWGPVPPGTEVVFSPVAYYMGDGSVETVNWSKVSEFPPYAAPTAVHYRADDTGNWSAYPLPPTIPPAPAAAPSAPAKPAAKAYEGNPWTKQYPFGAGSRLSQR